MLQLVVTGGQTGVDRAALDAAMDAGIGVAGWCPLGRKAEDGSIPARYPLTETPSADYEQRTQWNVRDSDATLILYRDAVSGGTLFTKKIAEQADGHHAVLAVDLNGTPNPARVSRWLSANKVAVLNVAGPRESGALGVYVESREFLSAVFRNEVNAAVKRHTRNALRAGIVNCTTGPGCPQDWLKLTKGGQSDVRHCGQCRKDVFLSLTPEAAHWHWTAGRCVAFVRPGDYGVYLGETPFGYEEEVSRLWAEADEADAARQGGR